MPHKMNTRSAERINGFAVILRGYASMVGELAGDQWNEGDVSCSVVRRVALPDAFFALDGLLETTLTVLDDFGAFPAVIAARARPLPALPGHDQGADRGGARRRRPRDRARGDQGPRRRGRAGDAREGRPRATICSPGSPPIRAWGSPRPTWPRWWPSRSRSPEPRRPRWRRSSRRSTRSWPASLPPPTTPPSPSSDPVPGADVQHIHSGKVRDLYRTARRQAAHGRQRPDLRLRLHPRHPDPRQGADPDRDDALVVRAARGHRRQPHDQRRRHPASRRSGAAGRCSAGART